MAIFLLLSVRFRKVRIEENKDSLAFRCYTSRGEIMKGFFFPLRFEWAAPSVSLASNGPLAKNLQSLSL